MASMNVYHAQVLVLHVRCSMSIECGVHCLQFLDIGAFLIPSTPFREMSLPWHRGSCGAHTASFPALVATTSRVPRVTLEFFARFAS